MTVLPPPQVVLEAFGLRPTGLAAAGGTAGRTWRVDGPAGRIFLRRRGPRTSHPARIAFDHGLRRHLVAHGFPTAAPLPARDGSSAVQHDDGVYEAYPWVPGQSLQPAVAAAARVPAAEALARFHELAAGYDGVCETMVPQFGHYPRPIPAAARFDWPIAFVAALEHLQPLAQNNAERAALVRARSWVAWLYGQYSASRWGRLPKGVIHGDYNACNLLFDEVGQVAGVFDFDWAWRESRVRDVGEGLFFFGAARDEATDGSDIWSLTACPRFDEAGMLEFLRAYHRIAPLTAEELQAVPLAMLGRWVACRTEGAMKVPEAARVSFATRDFELPFRWHEARAGALLNALG